MNSEKTLVGKSMLWSGSASRRREAVLWNLMMSLGILFLLLCVSASRAEEEVSWKDEFERLCGYTDIATTLDPPELTELITDCERLLERLEKLNEPKKKTYIFRTKKCRDLFKFVLETKGG